MSSYPIDLQGTELVPEDIGIHLDAGTFAGWTINDGTAASALGIERILFHFKNQQADSAEMVFPTDWDATLDSRFNIGSNISIYKDTERVFWGRVTKRSRAGIVGKEQVVMTAEGPWWWLENRTASGSTPWYNNNPFDPETATVAPRLLVTATQTASDVVTIVLGQNADVMQSGTINFTNPPMTDVELVNVTWADLLRSALRQVPGVRVLFDYRYSPPKLMVNTPGLSDVNYAIATDSVAPFLRSLEITPRDDLSCPGVILTYTHQLDLTRIDNTVAANNYRRTYPWADSTDTYPGGSVTTTPKTVWRSVPLRGVQTTVQQDIRYDDYFIDQIFFNGATFSRTGTGINAALRRLVYADADFWPLEGETVTIADVKLTKLDEYIGGAVSGSSWSADPHVSPSVWRPMINKDTGRKDFPSSDLLGLIDSFPGRGFMKMKWECSCRSGALGLEGIQWFYAKTLSWTSNLDRFAWSKKTNWQTAPSGLAQSLHGAYNAVAYEGRMVLEAEEYDPTVQRSNKITVSPAGTVIYGVQQVDVDAFSGTTTVSFGPPDRLSPDVFVSRLR